MNFPKDLVENIVSEGYSARFDKSFTYEGKEYHYFVNNSIFFGQMCRSYSLLAKALGVSSAEYDYIKVNNQTLIYVPSICQPGEELYESNILSETSDRSYHYEFLNEWKEVISTLPFKDRNAAMEEFYKQSFFGLLIHDIDKQISIVKDSNGMYRLGEYFDYGGVYMMQDEHEVDNDVYFDEEEFNKFMIEWNAEGNEYTQEKLQKDLETNIKKSVIDDYTWSHNEDEILKLVLPNISADFINKCFSTDIIEVISNDKKHKYSNNFKKVLGVMFETSKNNLIEKINEFSKDIIDVGHKTSK